jgi:CHAT domain-containing protein
VVVNPQLSPRPGYFDLADRSATGTTKEGQVVASLYPNTILLQRETATKMNLTKHWNDASLVYIAGHVIRDADIPYLLLVPLATTEGDVGPDAGYLDISDVRETDLTGCDLVVLSGCSSGAPYVGRHNTGQGVTRALCDVRREAMMGPNGIRHPFLWSAYSVKINLR